MTIATTDVIDDADEARSPQAEAAEAETDEANEAETDDDVGELVTDPEVAKELHVSLMTIYRWDKDPRMRELGWTPPIYIRKRKYRGRKPLNRFKFKMMRAAIRARGGDAP
jgi:DNA invertase Pin-like site-specific DNA recombinase